MGDSQEQYYVHKSAHFNYNIYNSILSVHSVQQGILYHSIYGISIKIGDSKQYYDVHKNVNKKLYSTVFKGEV